LKKERIIAFNKKLFKAFQIRGIKIGAVPEGGRVILFSFKLT